MVRHLRDPVPLVERDRSRKTWPLLPFSKPSGHLLRYRTQVDNTAAPERLLWELSI